MDKQQICELIPHSGNMCLLESVEHWSETSITCRTRTHQQNGNPLRNQEGLPMTALIEYGAQAMAVHGSLVPAESGERIQEGYLAALRDTRVIHGWLSDINEELVIHAQRLHAAGGNMIYQLFISAGEIELASGRATVVGISLRKGNQ